MKKPSLFGRWFTRAYALYHTAIILGFCALIGRGSYSTGELVGFTITAGLLGGAAFNVGHELIHRHTLVDDVLAAVLLSIVSYPTFQIEHIAHHHKWVATERDPSSAPEGASIYTHIPKAIVSNIWNAAKIGYRRSKSWGPRNAFVRAMVVLAAFYVLVLLAFDTRAVVFFAAQGLIAIVWLEIANYFQHYGLRREIVDGRPVPVAGHHSWDVDQPRLNKIWLNLPLHAHHHLQPSVSFDELVAERASSKYPFGYITCTLLALVPPLWTRFAGNLLRSQRVPHDDRDR